MTVLWSADCGVAALRSTALLGTPRSDVTPAGGIVAPFHVLDRAMPTSLNDLHRSAMQKGFRALNRIVVPAVKRGFGSPLPIGAGLVVLETTGRSSGLPRQVPLVAARFGPNIAVSTVRSTSQWVKNLEADPTASVWVAGRKSDGTATVETGLINVANVELASS